VKKHAWNYYLGKSGKRVSFAKNAETPTIVRERNLSQDAVQNVKQKNRSLQTRCFIIAGYLYTRRWKSLYSIVFFLTYRHMSSVET
jgi:hypothetical protein